MITVCHPRDEVEQMLLVAELEFAGIPCFINAEHFGSLYPGMQIPWYNEKSIRVPPSCYEEATDIVNEFRKGYTPQSVGLDATSKFRMLAEAVLFGWVMPYGTKKKRPE
ncbi:MAG: hypothetical protein H6978_08025 [Gammaproteobacteria bacterium]|nr:hypothetical protein [Gammaproteobacteria bacterium]